MRPNAPVVAMDPGAWFDADGGLVVVGAGRRLRLVLSAPIVACEPAFEQKLEPAELAARASLPYYLLSEACRERIPSILLAEEAATASPAELERTYREVAHCAAADLGATGGWVPDVVAAADPCPGALGLGWRLPTTTELQGLTLDDRKAIAGALFGAEAAAGFGSLLWYARAESGELSLVTLSPNAAEQAPRWSDAQRSRPFFGAALRCVPQTLTAPESRPRTSPPPLPFAQQCVKALQAQQSALKLGPPGPTLPELVKLRAWVERLEQNGAHLENEQSLRELSQLLAEPSLERLARDAREEAALTEHYAELAEGLDAADVSEGERQRRRAEFDNLRRRLGKRDPKGGADTSAGRELGALLAHLDHVLTAAPTAPKAGKKPDKKRTVDYGPLRTRVRELRGEKANAP